MIYLFTALYCEAHIFIKHFNLEKNLENTRFQEFYNETSGIRLIVTGIGEIASAAAVSSVCTEYKPNEGDVLLNVGTCAYTRGIDGVFLCNKIVEQVTGKTFYPDILYRHNFGEKMIVTGMMPWNGEGGSEETHIDIGVLPWDNENGGAAFPVVKSDGYLYDMEAASIYQSGSYFFGPHQMIFLKVVSDGGTAKEVSKEKIENLMEKNQHDLFNFMEQINKILCENKQRENGFKQTQEMLIEQLCTDLHCSKVMRDSLRQHIHYLELEGTDYAAVINDIYKEGLLPCKDKREGKLIFEEFKRRLF